MPLRKMPTLLGHICPGMPSRSPSRRAVCSPGPAKGRQRPQTPPTPANGGDIYARLGNALPSPQGSRRPAMLGQPRAAPGHGGGGETRPTLLQSQPTDTHGVLDGLQGIYGAAAAKFARSGQQRGRVRRQRGGTPQTDSPEPPAVGAGRANAAASSALAGAGGPAASPPVNSLRKPPAALTDDGSATTDSDGAFTSPRPAEELQPEDRMFLTGVLQKHYLLRELEEGERNEIVAHMFRQTVQLGDTICEQGQVGDSCYIIQSGIYAVTMDSRPVKNLKNGETFGELAMLYSCNRTASVACVQGGVLWRMDGACFRHCMRKLNNKHLQRAMGFLRDDPTFSTIKESERKQLAGACSVQKFSPGQPMLLDGEAFHCMFIVVEGTVQAIDARGHSSFLKKGSILGTAQCLLDKQLTKIVKAVDDVTCLVLAKCSLERLIGPVEDVFRRSAMKQLLKSCADKGDVDFFGILSEQQQNDFVDRLDAVTFERGETVAAAGAPAQFLVVIEGEVNVNAGEGTAPRTVLKPGMPYGAQNLLENAALAETLVARTRVEVRRMSDEGVLEALREPLAEVLRLKEVKKALGEVLLFKNLSDLQLDRVVRQLECKSYEKDEVIVQQGHEANHFYLIQSGAIRVVKNGQQLRLLGRWDYFGERGLLLQERRSASCHAEEACVCLRLDNATFHSIVGMFRDELEHRMRLQDLNVSMSDLRVRAVVGQGNFGIVKLVYLRHDERRMYALKCVSKELIQQQGQERSILIERDINAQCYHPCIMQFIRTFQDSKNLYFLTEFLGGGELFYAMREIGKLTKPQAQFYGGSLVLALEYLHSRGIMYRDLKPENVLLDSKGNAKLVDFGCCKKALRANTLVGTPEYMAPEIINLLGYTHAIDWWALGVILYELVVGPLPFGGDTQDQLELFREIREAPLRFPSYIKDPTALSVISGLLKRTPELRLGASMRGAAEIKEHPYFEDFDWDGLAGRYLPPPWTPNSEKIQRQWQMRNGEAVAAEESGEESRATPAGSSDWAAAF